MSSMPKLAFPQPLYEKTPQPRNKSVLSSRNSECPIADISRFSGRNPYVHIHSPGAICPACQALELESMEESFANLTFSEAFPVWLAAHTPYISPNTMHYYLQYGNPLMVFFGPIKLKDTGIGELRGFQLWRSHIFSGNDTMELALDSPLMTSKYRHAAGNVRIRNEINCVLKPILREAGAWSVIEAKKFKHLPIPREGSGVALTKAEQGEILAVGFSRPKWQLTSHCQRVMYKTGTGFGELRKMKRRHVDVVKGTITIIEGAKNNGPRHRTVTLVPSALESMKWIVARWQTMGGSSLDDYILPHRVKGFSVPMQSTYRSWIAIKKEWLRLNPGSDKSMVRQYDARVSAASILLQNPELSLSTIEKALGWTPSSAMRKRYNRADQNIQLNALRTLED